MAKETRAEQSARVEMMARGSGTWDLSNNDRAALQAMLDDHALLLGALDGLEKRATSLNRDMCVACGAWVAEQNHKPLCEIAVARTAIAKATAP